MPRQLLTTCELRFIILIITITIITKFSILIRLIPNVRTIITTHTILTHVVRHLKTNEYVQIHLMSHLT